MQQLLPPWVTALGTSTYGRVLNELNECNLYSAHVLFQSLCVCAALGGHEIMHLSTLLFIAHILPLIFGDAFCEFARQFYQFSEYLLIGIKRCFLR